MGVDAPVDEFGRLDDFPETPDDRPTRRRGACFYGCLGLVAVIVLGFAGLVAVTFFGTRKLLEEYTAPAPVPLPVVEVPDEERREIVQEVQRFEKAAEEPGDDTATITLNARQLNALAMQDPRFRGRLYLDIEGDKLVGQVSVPLSMLDLSFLKGRYLNGRATFEPTVRDGNLVIRVDDLTVNGRDLPGPLMGQIRAREFVIQASDGRADAGAGRTIELQEVRVADGLVHVTARRPKTTDPPHEPDAGELPP